MKLQAIAKAPWFHYTLALACGGLLVLAFAPYAYRFLAVMALVPVFMLWMGTKLNAKRAFAMGYAFGVGYFGFGVYWIYYSLYLFGDAIAPVAGLLTLLFVLFLALYPALLGVLIHFLRTPYTWVNGLVIIPFAWVLFEWWRGWFLTGFPWLLLGYTQIDTALGGYAPLQGVYGVSLVVAFMAGAIAWGLLRLKQNGIIAATWVVLIWLVGSLLLRVDWSHAVGEKLEVALLQGNIPQEIKWLPEGLGFSMYVYAQLHQQALGSDLILWPETAIPAFYDEIIDDYLQPLAQQAREQGGETLIGIFFYDPANGNMYNSIAHVNEPLSIYHKRHLVPFGEYLPLRSLLMWLDGMLQIPMADLNTGTVSPLLHVADIPIGFSVCYEDAFGRLVADALPQAHLLVNVSNDAWFGDSIAPHQHLEIARMRALETARPMLRATNTGISALIDQHGAIIARSPQFQEDVLRATLQPQQGATPFALWKDTPLIIFLFIVLFVASIPKITAYRLQR